MIDAFAAYRLRYPDEAEIADQFTSFLGEHDDGFLRTCEIGHFTGSAWIMDPTGERVLLTHHRKLDRWLQPGGHADGETDLCAVARREAIEETGFTDLRLAFPAIFDLDRHVIPARGSEPEHFHYDVRYLFRAECDDRFTVSEESHDLAWVPLGELENYGAGESILRMARKLADLPPPARPAWAVDGMAKQRHALVVGGTGMLRGVVLRLLEKFETVTVLSRRRTIPGTNPIHLDWHDSAGLHTALEATVDAFGPCELAVCWIHSTAPQAIGIVAETVRPARLFTVIGSSGDGGREAPPGVEFRRVRLGSKEDRWLTNREISAGVIEAIELDALDHPVGETGP